MNRMVIQKSCIRLCFLVILEQTDRQRFTTMLYVSKMRLYLPTSEMNLHRLFSNIIIG